MSSHLPIHRLVAASLLALAACGAEVAIDCDELQAQPAQRREVRVSKGGSFEVSLCSSKSTGFSWEAAIADPSRLAETAHDYRAPTTALDGAAGTEDWTFEAREQGATKVSFAYGRPWEGGEKASWTLELDVVVE